MKERSLWNREGNVWTLKLMPCVTVEPVLSGHEGTLWDALVNGKIIPQIKPNASSEAVKRAVWDYYDDRVNLVNMYLEKGRV